MSPIRLNIAVFLMFLVFTALLTYPQVMGLGTSVPYHSDPYFSMWRLGWVAHELLHDPLHLFEANIFFPAHDTLAYSDAMLLPGVVFAPLFWAGINAVVIYNLALFLALTLSGFTAFVLARRLTGSIVAGIVAGVVYAFAPYRFDHYMHLELQIVFWLPIALLLIHRIVTEGRLLDGVLLGGTVAAQALSSMYAAIFFVTYCAVFVPLLAVLVRPRRFRGLVLSLAVAASVTLAIVAPYSLAYARAQTTVGTRTPDDVRHYGASWRNYLAAPSINRLYGRTSARFGGAELNLFPGFAAIALGVLGIAGTRGRVPLAYAVALLFAAEVSRGLNGVIYPLLFQYLPPFRALRSPARIDIIVNLSIAILSAYGVSWLIGRMRRATWHPGLGSAIVAVLLIEYASSPVIARAPEPSRVDSWLAKQPPAVIVQLPLESSSGGSRDWLYMFEGLSHRQKMLNGYSGYVPASYYAMIDSMRSFPDDHSTAFLRDRRVDYVVIRGGLYSSQDEWSALLVKLQARSDLSLVSMFPDGSRTQMIYAIRK
jgi:hypothetical protein